MPPPVRAKLKEKTRSSGKPVEKPRIAIYWASSCGGCEIAFLEIAERILEVADKAQLIFCPCIMDTKYEDVRGFPDGHIDVTLFNGAIRSSENEEMARLLREKSRILIAYGSCAYEGCIPALANLTSKEEIINFVYKTSPSTHNPGGTVPQEETAVGEGHLELPQLYDCVMSLDQVVDVDYFVPGCPPVPKTTNALLDALFSGKLPAPGSVIGATEKSVCDDCKRELKEKRVARIKRPHLDAVDPVECLLDQGFLCCGPATRGGCGALCPTANMPCIGCYGPMAGVEDFGAKMLSITASVVNREKPEEIEEALQGLVDPAGYFNKFSGSKSLLFKKRNDLKTGGKI